VKKIILNASKLILVEGSSDKAFFQALLKNRGINDFEVNSPWDMGNNEEGEDAIKILLDLLPVHPNFENVKKIIIVVDSDNDPIEKFRKFQAIIQNTNVFSGKSEKYPVPTSLKNFASANNCPDVAVVLLPDSNTNGAMETLCLQAAIPNYPKISTCIDNFVNCINANEWSPQKNSKLKLRTLISSQYPKNPDLPTTRLWEVAPDIVPLNSPIFDNLANFLAGI
jgi:uncharacterized protein DUF3226